MGFSGSSRRAVLLIAIVGIGVVAAGAATGLPVAQMDQPSGDEILGDVEERYDDAETLTGTAEVTVENDSETKEATVDFAFAEPDQFRFVTETDDETAEVGSNGSVLWAVGEEESFAREIPSDSEYDDHEQPDDFVPSEDVDAELVDTTELDGEEAYVVELTPTDDADEKYEDVESTLWVSTDDSRVLQWEATDGETETTVEVTDQQFDVSIHDSTFEPPEDRVDVTATERYDEFDDLEAATDLEVPAYDDGDFEEASAFSSADGQAVIQQYQTDDGEVQIITATGAEGRLGDVEDGESVTVDGEDATAVEREDRSTVFWTEDGVTTGVVVEGSVDDATAVAEEIRE